MNRICLRGGLKGNQYFKGKIRKVQQHPSGYLVIGLRKKGKKFKVYVIHRLMWEAFRGPIPKNMQINHKNGIKTDNNLNNLELVTHAENIRHAARTGLLRPVQGTKHWCNKLNERTIVRVRSWYDRMREKYCTRLGKKKFPTGMMQKTADKLKVHVSLIHLIGRRKIWRHLK